MQIEVYLTNGRDLLFQSAVASALEGLTRMKPYYKNNYNFYGLRLTINFTQFKYMNKNGEVRK